MIATALRMLLGDAAKCVITIVGVAFAVMLVIVQVGLFRGLLANATVTIENADADLWVTSRNTPNIDFPQYFPDTLVQRVRSIPGVARADNLLVTYIPVQLPNGASETVLVYGIGSPTDWNLPWSMAEGSPDDLRRGAVMFLDDSAARRFGPFAVGEHRELLGQRLEIVGKTHGALSFTTMPIAFTSERIAQSLEPNLYAGRTGYILVKLASGADARAIQEELTRRLPYNDVYTSASWARKSRDYWVTSTGLGVNMMLTALLGVLVGTTVVAQTLYAAALDHEKEFGTLKAIGASNAHVCGIVVCQAIFAALAGYVVALPLVFLLRFLASKISLAIVVTLPVSALVLVGTVVLCAGASLLTFRRLVSIDPALVFRT